MNHVITQFNKRNVLMEWEKLVMYYEYYAAYVQTMTKMTMGKCFILRQNDTLTLYELQTLDPRVKINEVK